ncbi:unnamed protein product [Amoebophrya sp. A25]|nr:unnamed protein product [Amoebophrya sp. A25]|eukprot:GSA25T00018149001.1
MKTSQEQLFAHMNQDSARGGDRSVRGVDLLVEKWRERSSDSAGIAVASSSSGKAALSSVSRRASPSTSKAAVVSPGPAGVVGITPEKDGSSYSRRSSSDQRRGSRGYVQMREQRLQQRMRNSPFQLKGQTNSPTQVKGSHGVPQQSNTSAICTRQEEAEAPRRSASKEEPRTSSSSSTHPNQQKQHSSSRVSSATTTADANSSHCLLNSDLLSTINSVNSTLISTNSEIVPETTREVVVDSEAGSRDQPADAVERADVPTPFTPVDLERRKHPSRCSTAASSSSCETSGEKQLHYSHYLADDHKQDAPSYSLFRSANAVLAAQEAEATRGSQKQGAVSSSRNSSRMNFYSAAEEHEGYGSCSSSGVKTKSSYQLSTSVGHDHHPRSGVRMERQCSTLASHHASTACSPRRALQTSFSRETHTPPLSPAVVLGKACCRAPGISIQKSVLGGRSRTPTSSAQPSPSNHSSTSLTPSHSPCPSFSSPSSGGVVESGAASGGFSREKRGSNYRVEERDERQQSTPSYGGSLSSSGTATKQTTAKQVLERRFDPRRGCYSYGNGKHPGGYSTRAGSTSGAGLASLPSAFQPSARRAGPGPSVVISGDSPASSSRSSRTAVERRTKMWDQNFSPVSSTSSCMMNYQGAARGSATRQATTASVASSSSSKGHYEKPKSRVARIKLCVCANSATLARERCRLLKEEAAFFQDVQSWQAREKGLNERHARLESRKAQIAKRKAEEGSRKSAVAEAKKEVEQLKSETLPSLRQKSEAAAKQIADVRTALNEREGKVGEDRSKRLAEEDTFVAETSKERARWADKEKELRRKIAKMERKLGIEILSGTSSTSSSRIEATSLLEHKKDEDQDEDAIMLPQELALSLEETKIATDSVLDPLRKDVAALQNNVLSKRQTVERRRAELLPRKEKFEERRKRRRAFQDQIASVKREYALAVEKAEKTDAECAQLALSIRQFGEKIESSMSFAAEQCEIGDRLEEEVEDLHAKNAALEADLVARTRLKEAKQRQIREDARQRQEEALLRAGIDAKRSEEERREDAELELSMLQVHIETLKQSHKALNAAIEETTKAVEESREKAQANRDRRAAIRQRMKTQSLSLTGTTGGGTNG